MTLTIPKKAPRKPTGTIVVGIDPSTAATGVVVLEANGRTPYLLDRHVIAAPKGFAGNKRAKDVCMQVIDVLNRWRPAAVTIEGYGLSFKHPGSIVPLVEIGGLLRYLLLQYGYPFFDPRPGQLKKFATGNGQAKKGAVIRAMRASYDFHARDDNEADAYACALIALATVGELPLNQWQNEIVGELRLTKD